MSPPIVGDMLFIPGPASAGVEGASCSFVLFM
jgi:hypothetical protein